MKLFNAGKLSGYLEDKLTQMKKEIEKISEEELLAIDEELTEYLNKQYRVEKIILHEELKTEKLIETKIPESDSCTKTIKYVDGYRIICTVLYEGDDQLLIYKPSSHIAYLSELDNYTSPTDTSMGSLQFHVDFPLSINSQSEEEVRKIQYSKYNEIIAPYRTMIEFANEEVEKFNDSLRGEISQCLENCKLRISNFRELSNKLNIPLKLIDNAPNIKPIALRERQNIINFKDKPKICEYSIDDRDYVNIKNIIYMCATTMETLAKTFGSFSEESLRDVILATLNTHYEHATGETFRNNGKTDILIEFENKAAFIGECKIWDGEKVLDNALKQIFGYTTWRDNKVSLIIFNKKNISFFDVIDAIKKWVDKRLRLVKEEQKNYWSGVFYSNDTKSDISISIQVFNLLQKEKNK